MSHFKYIQSNLEAFIKRYYKNELLKGVILFLATGMIYLLLILFIEYLLWSNTITRTILFWLFVLVEICLLFKFIFFPLFKLLKLQKGINYETSSRIIGSHFPEVNDKLLNVLQLNSSSDKSEMLLASIEQKSEELNVIPFKLAVSFKSTLPYLKYLSIPLLILLFNFVFGDFTWFNDSYRRVVNYTTAYEPPAPFKFLVVNSSLTTVEGKDFRLLVKTSGDVTPDNAQVIFDKETYFLEEKGSGQFEFLFVRPKSDIEFRLLSNGVMSMPYVINVVEAPTLQNFNLFIDYPSYTSKKDKVLVGTGNVIVPEGTRLRWQLDTKATDNIYMYSSDTIAFISKKGRLFELSKYMYTDFGYTISAGNKNLRDYERMSFNIDVIKDEYPELNVTMVTDSINKDSLKFYGQILDDYGFSGFQLVYYPSDMEVDKSIVDLPFSNSNITDFNFEFPSILDLELGRSYTLYFQVLDNDEVNKYKRVKSRTFTYRKSTKEEHRTEQLKEQRQTINNLSKSFEKFEEQFRELNDIKKLQKEVSSLSFSEKKKLESFIKREREQNKMMENYTKKLKDNIEKIQENGLYKKQHKDDLEQRLEDNEERLKQDENLLDELEKLQDKINKEEFNLKLEELEKQNKAQKRSLKQLVELTKRFYVEKKLDKLKSDLNKLADEQEKLARENDKSVSKREQEKLTEQFDDFLKDIDSLEKDSEQLKKPIEIPRDKITEKEVQNEQRKASEALEKKEINANESSKDKEDQEKSNLSKAKNNQKNASKKMKELQKGMQRSMSQSASDKIQEDAEMLRQILDNLVLFSFRQEGVMEDFKSIDINHNKYASFLKRQSELQEHFKHIDDSLFALSLRQPKLSDKINNEISDVYYSIEKSLVNFAEAELYQGISSQQFAITASNNLSDYLSNMLDNMEESLNLSMGKGEGEMKLPDIIMSQEELNKMMEEGMKKGKGNKPNEVSGNKPGGSDKQGENEKGQKSGKDGKGEGKGEGEGKGDGQHNGKGKGNSDGKGKGNEGGQQELLYEIYQRQHKLRSALKELLDKQGKGANASALSLLNRMKDVEMELLNKGFTSRTQSEMTKFKHELIKLENASFVQGQDSKREGRSNKDVFFNDAKKTTNGAKIFIDNTEILNRQSLPFLPVYKKKVKNYFIKVND